MDKLFKLDLTDLKRSANRSQKSSKSREKLQAKGIDYAKDICFKPSKKQSSPQQQPG
jgi:hypothetical protein